MGLGCPNLPKLKKMGYAWNSMFALQLAIGGTQSSAGSLMCKHEVNLVYERQDNNDKLADAIVDFAKEYKKGVEFPQVGANFVSFMGDGSFAFLTPLNARLRAIDPKFSAKAFASPGRSLGEDKCEGLPQWKDNPQLMKGAYIAAVCKDGDWNICVKFALDNGLEINPDDKVYDPDKVNFMCVGDYTDAGKNYVTNQCANLKNVKTGQMQQVCVNGAASWTPVDVTIAEKRGGLIELASTRTYRAQMPNIMVGLDPWMKQHDGIIVGMIEAMGEAADMVRASNDAVNRAAQISSLNYHEEGTDADYWKKYYFGVATTDKQGVPITLGGSQVHNLQDMALLFGLKEGTANAYAATYETFAGIVQHYYPKDFPKPKTGPSIPPIETILDTSYLQKSLAKHGGIASTTKIETPVYTDVAASAKRVDVGHKNWSINFFTGRSDPMPNAIPVLMDLKNNLLVAENTVIEIHGHTDNTGDANNNMALSQARAAAVKAWLQQQAASNFPDSRFKVFAHGQTMPLPDALTDSDRDRARNRRVEVVLSTKQ